MSTTLAGADVTTELLLLKLAERPSPSTAHELAVELHSERSTINRLLYKLRDEGKVAMRREPGRARPVWALVPADAVAH